MNSVKRKIAGFLFGALGVVGIGTMEKGWAYTSTDTITILVTPSTQLSVKITSPTAGTGYDFSSVGLGLSTQSGVAAVVENDGDVASKWALRALALDTWSLGTSTGAQNVAILKALFGSASGPYPSSSAFEVVDSTLTTSTQEAVDSSKFSTGTILGASIPATGTDTRNLWFKLATPLTSSVATQQRFQVYAVALLP